MANTFGILAALVLAFASFVAYKNKESLQVDLDKIEQEDNKLNRNKTEHKRIVEEIEALDDETAQYESERKAKDAEVDKQNARNAGVETEIAEKDAEAKETEAKADEADSILKELGDIRELIAELKRLKPSIANLDDDLAVSHTKVSQLENQKTTTTTKSKDLSKQFSDRNTGKSYFVSTRVRSIYRNWGFVTLGAGDNAGVVAKSKVKVMRGEEEIARLIVTAVEANTASANIIPSSVNKELDIAVGDVVVPVEEAAPATAKK